MAVSRPAPPTHSPLPRLFLPCLIIFAAALAVRVAYARLLPVRVSADAAYYVMVAENLHHGRGFVSDYLWNYFAAPPLPTELPVPSNEYWMPAQSVLTAAAFRLANSTSLRVAQAPSLLLGALLCSLTAWIAGLLFRRRAAAWLAGLMSLVSFHLVGVSLYPDHFMLAACLVNLSLLALWAAWWNRPESSRESAPPQHAHLKYQCLHCGRLVALSGLLAGLAYLTRNDGALLGVAAAIPAIALLRRGHLKRALAFAASFCACALLVILPWLLRQKLVFGSFWGAGALRTAFLTDYNDIFRLDLSQLNLHTYLQSSQTVALLFKGFVFYKGVHVLAAAVGLAGLLALWALFDRDLRGRAAPWLVYLGAALIVPAFVFPFPAIKGGFWHLMPGLCPIFFALAAGKGMQLIECGRRESRAAPRIAGWLALTLALAYLLVWWKAAPREIASGEPPLYPLVAREAVLALDPSPRTVLTDSSWGLYHVAGVPCVQFPSDGAEAALQVADRFGASYLITQADAPDRLPAMDQIVNHPRFQPLARYPTPEGRLLVYRILPRGAPQPPSDSRLRMSQ